MGLDKIDEKVCIEADNSMLGEEGAGRTRRYHERRSRFR